MNTPASLRQGKILLLAGPLSFNAAYIRRTLDFFGVPVLAPPGTAEEAFATLAPADWKSVTACVAVDLSHALFTDLSDRHKEVPFLFVGYDPVAWFAAPYSWLCPPFASYQVIETLSDMVTAAAAATIRSTFDPPPAPDKA
jgi:hypothetical protein